jgi:murein L,D-transpeptidase YcbB/YkuD
MAGPKRLRRNVVVGVVALGLLLGTSCAERKKQPEVEVPKPLRIEDEIESVVASGGEGLGLNDTVGIATTWKRLEGFYRQRRNRPYWGDGRELRQQAKDLLNTIHRVEDAGLDPADYEWSHLDRLAAQSERANRPAERVRPRTMARFDVTATYAVLRVAEHLRAGRVPRRWLDPDWVVDSLTPPRLEALERTLGRDPSRFFAELEPGHPGYRRLRDALARYRSIERDGGWAAIPPGPPLKVGDRGSRVARLVRRLTWTDDFQPSGGDTVFDVRLERAIGSWQARMGIPVSGVVGEATREALNVPVERRIRQIELNLERWRWLPDSLGSKRVEINIPAYRLDVYRAGQIVRAMRVVVGKRKSPTPIFSDQITYLELNPTWTLPPSVVQKEIAPAVRRNKNYLQNNHMHVYSLNSATRDTLDPHQVPWKDAESDSFPYLVIQDAGPENPLGGIKLMCPNEYDVYLHDSPARSRFSVAVRDYSHGCVRVEHAVELADSLIGATAQDSVRLDSLVALGSWRRLRVPSAVPVHFLYWTAWVDSVGRMNYREDIYGLDQRLDAALKNRTTRDLDLNPGVTMSPLWLAAEARARERREALRSRQKR